MRYVIKHREGRVRFEMFILQLVREGFTGLDIEITRASTAEEQEELARKQSYWSDDSEVATDSPPGAEDRYYMQCRLQPSGICVPVVCFAARSHVYGDVARFETQVRHQVGLVLELATKAFPDADIWLKLPGQAEPVAVDEGVLEELKGVSPRPIAFLYIGVRLNYREICEQAYEKLKRELDDLERRLGAGPEDETETGQGEDAGST